MCAGALGLPSGILSYILLANFSFLEICYVNSDVPNMLANFFSQTKTISFARCLLQLYFFSSLGTTECFISLHHGRRPFPWQFATSALPHHHD